jgi:hypothetical protein
VKNASNLINTDFGELIFLSERVRQKFCEAIMDGPESLEAKGAVTAYRELINMLIPCDDIAFRKIAQAYLVNKEALDKKSPGLAEFVYKAILHVYQ